MLSKEEFNESLKKITRVAVDGVIIKDNKVLMILRGTEPFKNDWTLIGGFVDYNERPSETVVREVKEETGFETKVINFFGLTDDPDRDPRGHILSLNFMLEITGGEFRKSEEALEMKWFEKNNLPENIGFDHKKIINDAFKTLQND
ncbi:NUDIX domain-containing protein [Candidatus Aenigmatarchaeota archaeon]